MPDLLSKRLRFVNSTPETLNKILEGNDALASHLHIKVPEKWTEFGDAPFRYVLKQLSSNPEEVSWWNWLPVMKDENMLVGNCGYKGPPKEGVVEIGYEVVPEYRGIGLASEIAAVLIDNAFNDPAVTKIIAHTLAEENASCKVLWKCGFEFVEEINDPEDGRIWKWMLERSDR